MKPEQLLRALGGVARTSQLGGKPEIAAALRRGAIARVRRGVYCLDERDEIATAAAHGGSLTCISALRRYGVWVFEAQGTVHVDVGANGRVHPHPECACVDHHLVSTTRFGVAQISDALVAASRCLSDEGFFAAYESALHLALLTRADDARVWKAVRSGLRRLIALARTDADSGLESIFRLRMLHIGIALESQVQLDGIGRVDFRFRNLLIELDGRLNHEGDNRVRDLRRDAEAIRQGYQVLRLTYAMVMHEWDDTVQVVLAAIRAAGDRPSARRHSPSAR